MKKNTWIFSQNDFCNGRKFASAKHATSTLADWECLVAFPPNKTFHPIFDTASCMSHCMRVYELVPLLNVLPEWHWCKAPRLANHSTDNMHRCTLAFRDFMRLSILLILKRSENCDLQHILNPHPEHSQIDNSFEKMQMQPSSRVIQFTHIPFEIFVNSPNLMGLRGSPDSSYRTLRYRDCWPGPGGPTVASASGGRTSPNSM